MLLQHLSAGKISNHLLKEKVCETFNINNDDLTLGRLIILISLTHVLMFKTFHIWLKTHGLSITSSFPLLFKETKTNFFIFPHTFLIYLVKCSFYLRYLRHFNEFKFILYTCTCLTLPFSVWQLLGFRWGW